jgi:hypothetical protein
MIRELRIESKMLETIKCLLKTNLLVHRKPLDKDMT